MRSALALCVILLAVSAMVVWLCLKFVSLD
jgi:hypothetical protein